MAKPRKKESSSTPWARRLSHLWRQWSLKPNGEPRPWYQSPSFVVFAVISGLIILITIIKYPYGMPQSSGNSAIELRDRQLVLRGIMEDGYLLVRRNDLDLAIGRFHDALKIDKDHPQAHFALMLAYEGLVDRMDANPVQKDIDNWRLKSAEHAMFLVDRMDEVAQWEDIQPQWVGEAFVNAGRVHAQQANWSELKSVLELARKTGFTAWEVLETGAEFSQSAEQPEFQAIRREFLKR